MAASGGDLGRPTALVTGGRRGIGRASAFALAEVGFDVVINDLARDADAEETLDGIAKRGGGAQFVRGDLADLAQHERIVAQSWAAFGGVACLVNNAGVSVLNRGDLLDVSVESWDRCLGINLRGTFFLTQRMARRMIDAGPDRGARSIVTITSANAEMVSIDRGEYCVAKTGLSMVSQLFAVRLADQGIAVYEVRPGVIRTDMTRPAAERYQRRIDEGLSPIRRWGEPADVGRAVASLASGAIPFAPGQIVTVDGGLHINRL